jgi:hypothetical protein
MARSSWIVGVLLIVTSSLSAGAQEAGLTAGDRLRVKLSGARVEGRYVAGFESNLVMVQGVERDTVRIPMTNVLEVRVDAGERRRFVHDMLIGAVVGVAVGVVAGIPAMDSQSISDPGGFLVWTGSIVGALGAATGLVVAINPRTHWHRIWPTER